MTDKKILITGENSYIGNKFAEWLSKSSEKYTIDKLSVRGEEWKSEDFSHYAVLLHVAGIAHVSKKANMEELYYKVNRDLAIDIAEKAKSENVGQFIFMSSIIIYGKDGRIGEKFVITGDTPYQPVDFYGRSKLEADLAISSMDAENFRTAIVRAPVVYGPHCKGNFPKLIDLAFRSPFFLALSNERSMIYIDNLTEFLKLLVDNQSKGIFFPQNKEYISTSDVVKVTAEKINKKIFFLKAFNGKVKLLSSKMDFLNKIFGNKVYDQSLSGYFDDQYRLVGFEESIENILREERSR